MKYQQRTAALRAKVQELVSQGMSYDLAHCTALKLPEMQHIVNAMHQPGKPVAQSPIKSGLTLNLGGKVHPIETPEQRSVVLANAIQELRDRCKYDYPTAYNSVKGDSRYAPLFAAMVHPRSLAEVQILANAGAATEPSAERLERITPKVKLYMSALAITWAEALKLVLAQDPETDGLMELPPGMKPKSPVGNIAR